MTKPYHEDHLKTLTDIRSIMERSTRFISLSGLSGVGAGLCALIGAAVAFYYIGKTPFEGHQLYYESTKTSYRWGMSFYQFFLLDGALVLISALACGIFFTTRKAQQKGQKIWDRLTLRLLVNLAIPLLTGAVFCYALFEYRVIGLIAPATLIFYGLSLVNASKYTLRDLKYLGLLEIGLGLLALFNVGYGLEFWTLGFGVLHIVYGTYMWWKYERKSD
ncbi:MAG: hypothetical protein AAF849_03645 [Bacteroidota bacterium]